MGEIESALLQHHSVQEAVVNAREDKNKDNYLCAYVKGIFEKVPAGTILREYLLHTLPDYMIPSYFIQVEKMPLTPSGKVDRKALPAPESMESRVSYAAPRNEIEKELTVIWSGVLNVHQSSIGIDNNFFE
ncbi:MAG: non-ribosomal peptide synthetase, partial [Candidatus Aminicenantes bacterium]|nr:non-ribosomal peptide synthetase [Candidatus Aminicenantes bacterium]NIQ69638.1 non-ribosomal peptide synthetase [Candidatus Aminicenantes bacterium]NIT25643.1 non-ribosomal peptide synthetase [Candidatus Aminicenantes bacterium]